jgi:hypothetical protein
MRDKLWPNNNKKLQMKKSIFIFCLIAAASFCSGQDKIDKTVQFKDSTVEYTVHLKVKKGAKEANFLVVGFLENGELSFKIADPEGKKEGGFGLSATGDDGKTKPGSGRMTHTVKIPIPGTWTVTIKATKATGNLTYKLNIIQL